MKQSELGFSFGNVAETYHRVRPPYSQRLLDRAQEALELHADARVLDLAAGTGRLTRELAVRFGEVVAVEPDETHWWETEPPLPGDALELLSEPYERSRPRRRPPWDDAFAGSPFQPLNYERATDTLTISPDELLTLYSTTSSLAELSDDDRAMLLARVRPLLGVSYRLPLRHELTWTRLSL